MICVDLEAEPRSLGPQVDPKDLKTLLNGDDPNEELIPTHELLCQRYGDNKATFLKCDVSLEHSTKEGEMYGMSEMFAKAAPHLKR